MFSERSVAENSHLTLNSCISIIVKLNCWKQTMHVIMYPWGIKTQFCPIDIKLIATKIKACWRCWSWDSIYCGLYEIKGICLLWTLQFSFTEGPHLSVDAWRKSITEKSLWNKLKRCVYLFRGSIHTWKSKWILTGILSNSSWNSFEGWRGMMGDQVSFTIYYLCQGGYIFSLVCWFLFICVLVC